MNQVLHRTGVLEAALDIQDQQIIALVAQVAELEAEVALEPGESKVLCAFCGRHFYRQAEHQQCPRCFEEVEIEQPAEPTATGNGKNKRRKNKGKGKGKDKGKGRGKGKGRSATNTVQVIMS